MQAIQMNDKTGRSFDTTTNCPKRVAGAPCKYCYVEASRNIGYSAKLICSQCTYNNEVLRLHQSTINKLNSYGGIRMFSFGDYMSEHDAIIKAFLDDCQAVGLSVKAITKQVSFIDKWAMHPAIRMIHISVDNVGDGVPWETAKLYREAYPGKVLIRCAVMRDEDVSAMSFADVFTFNHALGLKKYGFKKFRNHEVKAWNARLNGHACCAEGGCKNCSLKCGVNLTETSHVRKEA